VAPLDEFEPWLRPGMADRWGTHGVPEACRMYLTTCLLQVHEACMAIIAVTMMAAVGRRWHQ
jgi:hypothetical protein